MNTIDSNGTIIQQNPADMAKLYAKMARVMGKCKRVKKDGENKFHNYKYATAADVADEVRQYLAEEGIAFFANMSSMEIQDGVWVVGFDFTFACGDTGATITSRWYSEAAATNKAGRDDKGLNKAATTAEKYFLLKTFILSAGDESDADEGTPQPAPRKQTQQTQPPHQESKVAGEIAPHWTTDAETVKRLNDKAFKDYMLSAAEVLKALGVKEITEYRGTAKEALDAVIAYDAKLKDAS